MESVSAHGDVRSTEQRSANEISEGFTYFRKNDVLVAKITPCFENGKGAVLDNLPTEIGFGSTEFIVLRARPGVDPRFLYLLTTTPTFRQQGADAMTGSAGQQRVPLDFIKNFNVAIPPLHRQEEIVSFMRRIDARITRLIRNKRRLIALLNEEKQAIIQQAVTRGLDPDVPMKPSGVEWLGEIPAHWKNRRLKALTKFVTSGSRGWAEHYSDYGPIFLRIGNISTTSIDLKLDRLQRVSPPPGSEGERTRVIADDILVSITAQMGAVGLVPTGLGEAFVNQHTALVRLLPELTEPRWAAYCLLSPIGKHQINLAMNGGTKVGLTLDDVRSVEIPLPPIEEQREATAHLDQSLQDVERLTAKVVREIDLIREYRTRLIADVVTGQLDVRNVLLDDEAWSVEEFDDYHPGLADEEVPVIGEADEPFDDESDVA